MGGDIDQSAIDDDLYNSYIVTRGADAILDGFIIEKGYRNSHGGAGMYNSSVSPVVSNCIFRNNTSLGVGGAMYNTCCPSAKITNCTFEGNEAGIGGAVFNDESSPEIVNCKFIGNQSTNINDVGGGAIFNNYWSSPSIMNCFFVDNISDSNGGAMVNGHESYPEIKNCVFYGNEAKDGDGGAIFNYDESSPLIISCTFAENTVGANYDGLGVYNCDDSTSIVNSCIFWNESTSDHQIINDGSSASVIGFSDVQDCGGSGVANWEPVFGFDAGGNIDSAPDFYNYTDVNGADNKLGTSDDGLLPMFYGVIDSADGYNVTLRDITNNERVDAVSLVDMSGGPITYADMGAYETFYYFYGFDYEPNVVVMCFINESDGDAYSDNFLGEDLYNADMKEYVDILMDNSSYKIASGCFVPGNPVYAVIPNACELPDNIYTSTFPRDNPSPLQSDFKNAFRTICGYGQPDDIIIVIDNSGSMTPDTLNVDGAYDNFLVWLGDEYTTTNIYQYTIKNPYIGGNFDGTSGTDCIERWLDAINEALKKLSYIN